MLILNVINYGRTRERIIVFWSFGKFFNVFLCFTELIWGGLSVFCFQGLFCFVLLSSTSEWDHSFSQSYNIYRLRKYPFLPLPHYPEVVMTLYNSLASTFGSLDIFPSLFNHQPSGLLGLRTVRSDLNHVLRVGGSIIVLNLRSIIEVTTLLQRRWH